jgi:hypothetical protein
VVEAELMSQLFNFGVVSTFILEIFLLAYLLMKKKLLMSEQSRNVFETTFNFAHYIVAFFVIAFFFQFISKVTELMAMPLNHLLAEIIHIFLLLLTLVMVLVLTFKMGVKSAS